MNEGKSSDGFYRQSFRELVGLIDTLPWPNEGKSNSWCRWYSIQRHKEEYVSLVVHITNEYPKDITEYTYSELVQRYEDGSAAPLNSWLMIRLSATPKFNQLEEEFLKLYGTGMVVTPLSSIIELCGALALIKDLNTFMNMLR